MPSAPASPRRFPTRWFPEWCGRCRRLATKKLAIAGGVAANSRIRKDVLEAAEKLGVEVFLPPLKLCGDNAAMIGSQGYYEYLAGHTAGMELNAYATKSILGETL